MSNPEDKVIDAIDALVDWQLAHPPLCSCPVCPEVDYDDCPICHHDWHGTGEWGCPGAFGTEAEVEAYRRQCELELAPPHTTLWFPEEYRRDGVGGLVAAWADTFNGAEVGQAWAHPTLNTRRIVWNVT